MRSSSIQTFCKILWVYLWTAGVLLGSGLWLDISLAETVSAEETPITFRVVAVNPSASKTQEVPVKIYLPQEVKPRDIVDLGGLELEYDDQKSSYFVYRKGVELAPRETKIFEVFVKDVWMVPQSELDAVDNYAKRILKRLEATEYYDEGKTIVESIAQRLAAIAEIQGDQALSRKQHIGAYRLNLQTISEVKEDLARMEKLLTFTGGVPVPQMLQESPIKSDSPTTKTTWMIIIMIMIFLALFGGLFFFTWYRKMEETQDFANIKELAFPENQQPPSGKSSQNPDEGEPPVVPPEPKGRAA